MKKHILLTFDLEEFDLPLEFKQKIKEKRSIGISRQGLLAILKILDKYDLKATFFVTSKFAIKNKSLIKKISKNNEIAFHGLVHSDNYLKIKRDVAINRLKKGKKIIEQIIGKKIYGFRAPRFHTMKIRFLNGLGIVYDSSLHPTYIPGRYNNFFTERRIHKHGNLIEIPVSVTSILRLPLFWFIFRNLGLGYSKFCTNWCFLDSKYVMLLFHPWEFIDLNKIEFKLPLYLRRNTGKTLSDMLEQYIRWAKNKGYEFSTIKEFLQEHGLIKNN